MSAPLPLTGAATDPDAWQELEECFATLGHLARSSVAPDHFYHKLLEESVRALSATGGVVWLRAERGALQPAVRLHWAPTDIAANADERHAHELLLDDIARRGEVVVVPVHSLKTASTPSDCDSKHMLLVGPVQIDVAGASSREDQRLWRPSETLDHPTRMTVAIIELALRPDASPSTYRGCEQFLAAVCEIAADYHARAELLQLKQGAGDHDRLLRFADDVHRSLNLTETAYTVANEGRNVAGCDRLSVLAATGSSLSLVAASGASRVEPRSNAARSLEQVAELVRRTGEPAWYTDAQTDALPPIDDALERHAEASHARQIAVVPLHRPPTHVSDASGFEEPVSRKRRQEVPSFVLVAEQFDVRGDGLRRDRLLDVSLVATTALYNALDMHRLPLGWLLRPLAAARETIASHLTRSAVVVAALLAAVAALIFVPADFTIEATGALQPVVRRDVFAPRSGLVDEVLVAHGRDVEAGTPLVRLRDPQLELELKRLDGELETTQRQRDAVRATRTNREVRDANPLDAYRLSAEERELDQQLANLREQRTLLENERAKLVIVSPIAGRVLTWDVGSRLVARPVERGDVLVTVANLSADWQLELNVPDDQIGHVIAARAKLQPDLPVEFRLSSDDRKLHAGHISEVCMVADVDAETSTTAAPTVLVKVALDEDELEASPRDMLRPGVSARAQIACGRRALGYVWLHDIWDATIGWLRF